MKQTSFKKTAAFLLAFAVELSAVCGTLPSDNVRSVLSGSVLTACASSGVFFDAESGVLTLSGSPAKADIQAYSDDSAVSAVIAEEGTVLPADSSYLFQKFRAKTIDLSKADTSGVTDMSFMFAGCSALNTLDITGFNTSAVTNMQNMFEHCLKLSDPDLSGFDTAKVTDMSSMFSECRAIKTPDLRSFDTSNVTDMSRMFNCCNSLTKVDLSGFDTANVLSMSYMFYRCTELRTIVPGDWDLSAVLAANAADHMYNFDNNLSRCFVGGCCLEDYDPDTLLIYVHPAEEAVKAVIESESGKTEYDLTEDLPMQNGLVELSYVKEAPLERITLTFYDSEDQPVLLTDEDHCRFMNHNSFVYPEQPPEEITETYFDASSRILYLAGEVEKTQVQKYSQFMIDLIIAQDGAVLPLDCSQMFKNFWDVKQIDLRKADASNVANMNEMFCECSAQKIDLSGLDTSNVHGMGSVFDGCSEARTIDVSGWNTENATTMAEMFKYCKALTELDLSSFHAPNVSDISSMFESCYSLRSVTFGDFDISRTRDMSFMFSECQELRKADLSSFHTSNVKDMTEVFYNCENLEELDVSSFDTSSAEKMNGMFRRCSGLKELDVRRFDTSKVMDLSMMFSECSSLTELNVRRFNTSNAETMLGMFAGCKSLQQLNLWSFDTSKVYDTSCMFADCSSLKSLDLSYFEFSDVRRMHEMFRNCSSLTELDISHFDTFGTTTVYGLFADCSALEHLYLGDFDMTYAMAQEYKESYSEMLLNTDSLNRNYVTEAPVYVRGEGVRFRIFTEPDAVKAVIDSHYDRRTIDLRKLEKNPDGCYSLLYETDEALENLTVTLFDAEGRQLLMTDPEGDQILNHNRYQYTDHNYIVRGDVDCSGSVDVGDAVLLARLLAEDRDAEVTNDGLRNADVNGTGRPDSGDVQLILQYIARLISF